MKLVKLAMAGLLMAAFAPSYADNKMDDGKKAEYYKRHHRTLQMLKETMAIVAGMNHTPSAEDKKKLEGMMKELDDMMNMEMPHHGDGHHHDKK